MFKGAKAVITGGTFTYVGRKVVTGSIKDGFERLQDRVAKTAFHNSAQRLNPPRCHTNTRTALIQEVMSWIRGEKGRSSWILWLTAAAGAGKSAIFQSVAELCDMESIPLATFFFFRTDPTRNHTDSLVATLAYQVAVAFPEVLGVISQAVERDPLIFERSLESQMDALVIEPLHNLGYLSTESILHQQSFVFMIDGIDECAHRDAQVDIIRTIAEIVKGRSLPIVFLVSARGEPHLTMEVNKLAAQGLVKPLLMDEKYSPTADIRLFISDKFTDIREYHPFKVLIPQNWPAPHQVDNIVAKSSGQFIYASVIMHYLSAGGRSPIHSLEIVEGAHPIPPNNNPFLNLDMLYEQIFSNVVDLEATLCTLAYSILTPSASSHPMHEYLNWTPLAVQIALADLLSVVDFRDNILTFLHGSLPDYLIDKNRSQSFHIDTGKWSTYFALHWFKRDALRNGDDQIQLAQLTAYLKHSLATRELYEEIIRFEPGLLTITDSLAEVDVVSEFLSAIDQLQFDDGNKAYHNQVKKFVKAMKSSSNDLAYRQLSTLHPENKSNEGAVDKWTRILATSTPRFRLRTVNRR